MLKLIRMELRKLGTHRIFLLALPLLLAANLFILWYANRPDDFTPSLSAQRALADVLDALPAGERLAYVQAYHDDTQAVRSVARAQLYASRNTEEGDRLARQIREQNPEAYDRALDRWRNGGGLRFASTVEQEAALAEAALSELKALDSYEEYLDDIRLQADNLTGISIFSSAVTDGFSARNIRKTAADYRAMEGTLIDLGLSRGIPPAVSSLSTDVVALLYLFIFAFILVSDERGRNLTVLIRPTAGGRAATAGAKILTLAMSSLLVTLLLYGGNLLYFQAAVGLGDLSRSLQSVAPFIGGTLPISVGAFLALTLLWKWGVCFLLGLGILLVTMLCRRVTVSFSLCAAILLTGYALFRLIPDNSRWTFLKYASPFGLLNGQELFGRYLNINLFGRAVSHSALAVGIATVLLAGFTAACIAAYCRMDGGGRSWKVHLPPVFQYHAGKSVGRQEWYKLLWAQKAALPLAVFLILSIHGAVTAADYVSPDEMARQSMMQRLAGPLTADKAAYLEEWRTQLEAVSEQLSEVDAAEAGGALTRQEAADQRAVLEGRLAAESILAQAEEKLEYVRSHPGTHFVYDTGYNIWLFNSNNRDIQSLLTVALVIVLCLFTLFPMETAGGMVVLIRSSPVGLRRTVSLKLRIGLLVTAAVVVTDIGSRLLPVLRFYGLAGLSAPAASLSPFEGLPGMIPLWAVLAADMLLKLLACLAVSAAVMALSFRLRHPVHTLLAALTIVGLPPLLALMGLDWGAVFSFIAVYRAAAIWTGGAGWQLAVYIPLACLVLFGSVWYIRSRSGSGKGENGHEI